VVEMMKEALLAQRVAQGTMRKETTAEPLLTA
jgi:hypothetical protein